MPLTPRAYRHGRVATKWHKGPTYGADYGAARAPAQRALGRRPPATGTGLKASTMRSSPTADQSIRNGARSSKWSCGATSLGVARAAQHADDLAACDVLADIDPDLVEMDQDRGVARARRLVALDDDRHAVAVGLPRRPLRGRIDDHAVEWRQDRLVLRRVDVDAVMQPDELARRRRPWRGCMGRAARRVARTSCRGSGTSCQRAGESRCR